MEAPSDLVHERSGQLVRSASQLFTSGAAIVNESPSFGQIGERWTGSQSLLGGRQSTVQDVGRAQGEVRARVVDEMIQSAMASIPVLCLFIVLLLSMVVAIWVVWVKAFVALLEYGNKPCDQPLEYYLAGSAVSGIVVSRLQQAITRALVPRVVDPTDTMRTVSEVERTEFKISIGVGLLGFVVFIWGIYMVTHAHTCPVTNPGLYYPTRLLIYSQLILTLFAIAFRVALKYGLTFFMLPLLAKLNSKPGCESAVHQLPKFPASAPELVDESGVPNACPICLHDFQEGAVKTPCEHFFHEDCLAQWCNNHLDCPLCRQPVGDADPEQGGGSR